MKSCTEKKTMKRHKMPSWSPFLHVPMLRLVKSELAKWKERCFKFIIFFMIFWTLVIKMTTAAWWYTPLISACRWQRHMDLWVPGLPDLPRDLHLKKQKKRGGIKSAKFTLEYPHYCDCSVFPPVLLFLSLCSRHKERQYLPIASHSPSLSLYSSAQPKTQNYEHPIKRN